MNIPTSRIATAIALASMVGSSAHAGIGDTATFAFDLPATGIPSLSPPYPSVASLVLVETASGVDFTLSPNWGGPGFDASASKIMGLDFVYSGIPSSPTFANFAGANIQSINVTNNANMDAGYTSTALAISIKWKSANNDNFGNPDTSSWSINGTGVTLVDFTGEQASANNKTSPIFGVISVSSYELPNSNPNPSNWVAGVVPEPEAYAMALAALGVLGVFGRLRRNAC